MGTKIAAYSSFNVRFHVSCIVRIRRTVRIGIHESCGRLASSIREAEVVPVVGDPSALTNGFASREVQDTAGWRRYAPDRPNNFYHDSAQVCGYFTPRSQT